MQRRHLANGAAARPSSTPPCFAPQSRISAGEATGTGGKQPGTEKGTPTASPKVRMIKVPFASETGQHKKIEPDGDTPDLPDDEFFVEGGIELSPPREVGDGLDSTSGRPPLQTRPLAQLEERQLDEFWPRGSGPKALFLDYDGTLREFEARPELAVPTQEIKDLLDAINAREDLAPHIISGRNASFLGTHFGHLHRFTLVAEHGFQIRRPGEDPSWALLDGTTNHEIWKSSIRSEISRFLSDVPGSHLEEKASSLVWHYREVSDQAKAADQADDLIGRLTRLVEDGKIEGVRISHGHKIVEASYQKARKGLVMRKLCEEKAIFGEAYEGVLVAGDDVTDESMFDAAPRDYLTIKVGSGETSAIYRVDSPQLLRAFLWKILRPGESA